MTPRSFQGTEAAFSGYVEDEEFLRKSLRLHEGRPLKEWKRDFILHRGITRPTRTNVVGRQQKRLPLNKGWTWPKSMHLDSGAQGANEKQFHLLRDGASLTLVDAVQLPGVVDRRENAPRNELLSGIELSSLLEFLLKLRFTTTEDSMLMTAATLALTRELERNPHAIADVVFMSELKTSSGAGRNLDVLRENIHVGMNPSGATGEAILYSGDRSVVNEQRFTIQLRAVKLSTPAAPMGENYGSIPWLAMHFPQSVANHAWLEDD